MTLILIIYIVVGMAGIASYNCAGQCLSDYQLTIVDKIGVTIASPSLYLVIPMGLIFSSGTLEKSYGIQLLILVTAIAVEILFLYTLSCILVFAENLLRRKRKSY